MNEIEKRMEELKNLLHKLTKNIDIYWEGKVLEVSQELDEVIYEYMKIKKQLKI